MFRSKHAVQGRYNINLCLTVLTGSLQGIAERPRPIVSIGAGGIVRDAHLPAYKKAGFPVVAIADLDKSKAENLARAFHMLRHFIRTLHSEFELLETDPF
jgi:shikimate 5-dehydrogenase